MADALTLRAGGAPCRRAGHRVGRHARSVRLWRPRTGLVLLASAGLAVGSTAGVVWSIVRTRRRPPGERALARLIEERCPALEDRLATAVDLRERVGSTPFAAALETDASRVLAQVPLDDVVPEASIVRARRIAVAGGLAAARRIRAVAAAGLASARGRVGVCVAACGPSRRHAWQCGHPARSKRSRSPHAPPLPAASCRVSSFELATRHAPSR